MVTLFVALIALVVGSFLNVVILRLHDGQQFVKGRSRCPHCKRELEWYELIPLISWVLQRGKCRNCRKRISVQYPIVEALTALVLVLAYHNLPIVTAADLIILLLWFYILASLIVLAVYDIRWYLLPDRVLLPLMVPAAAIIIANALATQSLQVALGPIEAAVLFGGFFYALAAVSKGRWMGGGDIKLAFVMGLLLGLQKTALAMLIAFNSAAIVGGALILLRRKKRTDFIPFGPFLIAGTIISFLWGSQIVDWYLNFTGLTTLL